MFPSWNSVKNISIVGRNLAAWETAVPAMSPEKGNALKRDKSKPNNRTHSKPELEVIPCPKQHMDRSTSHSARQGFVASSSHSSASTLPRSQTSR